MLVGTGPHELDVTCGSSLSLIPSSSGRVAGWNTRPVRTGKRVWLGTLLGPEETPFVVGSLWLPPAWPSNASWWVWWWLWGWGVVVC